MATLGHLRDTVTETQAELERIRSAYLFAARVYLIADLLDAIAHRREITGLRLSAEYEYDDEGGYFRWLHGTFTRVPDTPSANDLDDCWTEGLDVDHEVVLELFGIDNVGEGTLTRAQLESLSGESHHTPPGYGRQPDAGR